MRARSQGPDRQRVAAVRGAARDETVVAGDDRDVETERLEDVLGVADGQSGERDHRLGRAAGAAGVHEPGALACQQDGVARIERAGHAKGGQLAEPIRWKDCMDACSEFGATVALELGPGAALSRMLQARHPHIACRSVSEFRSLDGVRSWLNRHAD